MSNQHCPLSTQTLMDHLCQTKKSMMLFKSAERIIYLLPPNADTGALYVPRRDNPDFLIALVIATAPVPPS